MNKVCRTSGFLVAASVLISGLSGCAGYGVELQGGLFDLVGLNDVGKPQPEPKVKKRNTLVVPPSTDSLPVPGQAEPQQDGTVLAANGEAWPVDPDKVKAKNTAALKAQHEAFCEKARKRFELKLDTVLATGPLGSCNQSILRSFTNNTSTAQ